MNKIKTIITEEHSSQLHVWHQLGFNHATLIYLDAHLDLQHISESRITKLKNCSTTAEIASLEKPYHMVPDQGYSYSIEDFLYAAHHLEMIDRVIWVHPFGNNHNSNPMDTIRMLQDQQGFGLDDFTSFEIVNNYIEANLLGLNVTICGYQDLSKLTLSIENTFIDIDIDYFIALPQDRPWINPKLIFQALKLLPIKYDTVTFTRSVTSGYMPLRYRFIADYLSSLWQEEQLLAEHYMKLLEFDAMIYAKNTQMAKQGFLGELANFPQCPTTYYFLSLCETDVAIAEQYLKTAAKLSNAYSPSVLRSINAILSRDLKFDQHTLKSLESRLEIEHLSEDESQLTHFCLGLLYSSINNLEGSLKHYQTLKKEICPQLSLAIGNLSLQEGKESEAIPYLIKALEDESTEPEAHHLLGCVYFKEEEYDLALSNLLLAKDLIPSSKRVVKLLAQTYKQLGDDDNYQVHIKQYNQMKFFLH